MKVLQAKEEGLDRQGDSASLWVLCHVQMWQEALVVASSMF